MRLNIKNLTCTTLAITTLVTSQMALLPAIAQTQNSVRKSAMEEGTVLPAKLNETLSSSESHSGDAFTATVLTEKGDYYERLPRGTRIEGVVRVAKPKKDKDPGVLELSFQRIRYPNGRSQAIEGSLIGLDNKSVTKTSDGRLIAKSKSKNDRLTYVGIGAGAGLIVSLFTKRTFQDTLLGAGLGYLFGSLQKSDNTPRDVLLKPGTEFGIRIDRRFSYASYSVGDGSDRQADSDRRKNDDRDSEATSNDPRDRAANPDKADVREGHETAEDIGVLYGDKSLKFDSTARPILVNGEVLIPIRPVFEEARVKFNYDNGKQSLTANGRNGSVRVVAGSRIAIVDNEKRVRMETTARRLNGTFYVPMRFLSLALGQDVSWDEGSRTVLISAPESEPDQKSDSNPDAGKEP